MDESKRDTPIDLARIDTHVISDREYDEIPELTDEDFARGTWSPGREWRSALKELPQPVIAADVLERFRATGPGWEERINTILREASEALALARD
jgi:uncharacterized protein (DUF4415 family)